MVNQEELIKGTLNFINAYKRLPYLQGDSIEVEKLNDDNEVELKPYMALKYIKEHHTNQDKFTETLFEQDIITYNSVGNILGLTPTVVRNIVIKSNKNPDIKIRRQLEIFFNKDFYKDDLPIYNEVCETCTKQKTCGQAYWIGMVNCKKYKKKKIKSKNTDK